MNIIILGAGELGKQLAWTFCDKKNKVVVVDTDAGKLDRLRERLDVMTVHGDCADYGVLKQAGVTSAGLLLAVTGTDASNVLGCHVARHFGVAKTVCRLSSSHFFSEEDGFPPSALGIDHTIFPEEECVSRILNVLQHRDVVERITFLKGGTEMCGFRVNQGTPLDGVRLRDFADKELLSRIRFSALIRSQRLFAPSGDTAIQAGDEVYVAGKSESVNRLLDSATDESKRISFVVLAGATNVAEKLVKALVARGFKLRLIERNETAAARMIDRLDEHIMVIKGSITDAEVLEDAGVGDCDAFISASRDDEDNILSCVLAKKLGAGKVINISSKGEYMDIVPSMTAIDCGFSPRLGAVNAVLSLFGNDVVRVHAILHRAHAYVYEFEVQKNAPVCDRRIADCGLPANTIFSIVFRGNETFPATGDVVLQEADIVSVVTAPREVRRLERLFRKKGIIGL